MNLRKENILIVDDNYETLDFVQRTIKALNFNTYKASSVNEAIDVLKSSAIDLLITDLNMPEVNGIELLKYTEEHFPVVPKLVITGFPTVNDAINALKSGALDYLIKPFTNEELNNAIKSSLLKMKNSFKAFNSDSFLVPQENSYSALIGQSSQFKELVEMIKRVKDNKANILIEGESGTGKELIAKAIHNMGALAKMPFISINCGGIPESLLESELFGYTKGAFTGAAESKIGLFQAAAGGTIFLDEIGNASMAFQTRLLRVLQEKEITRIGATTPEKINIRIIAATNSDLRKMVLDGTFREDLFYRINVINIQTSPLRERKEDIVLLANNFIAKYAAEYHNPKVVMDDKVMEVLIRYDWPGNIRELENIMQRMIIMSDEIITLKNVPDDLKYHIPHKNDSFKTLKEYEKEQIVKVLNSVGNNKSKAAKILNIDRKTLNQKIT
ncbi:DNA-binding transcriptional response regulator, NtrC family, contains REC, AAA-type ATPase, and a Fis-type DNA-binding domains [Flavobacterium sp. CF108]|uniref:sigma-54-dependent transcriptional regulator n=1 Tax=unclassified Flavobacterium TaxID=196869 RepID=UPI0008B6E557|nr:MULTISPECIES: sigma-54 dependent transcriptional regulator [unclassified Flavobacterium]SEO62734.1 DNA-binding transcriptional response regulator, NtrC family, contains REC, AAA-type ATPase, and a Fis-type DNA-binding domains [Flavobacterium sp. fv08]SHI07102.1 DNA-binding transcriptional response regulator, NtrC family, contains REC, AAA-type ATPase, and a Fis-type DNA-binding domains [Flavobacterium sp. CF108]